MRCLPRFFYFFNKIFNNFLFKKKLIGGFFAVMSQVGWPIIQKLKLLRVTKNEGYILRHGVRSLWPTYLGERRTTFAKAYRTSSSLRNGHDQYFIPKTYSLGRKRKIF
jgi:hypothetical protein